MRLAIAGYPLLSERQWRLCEVFDEMGVDTHLVVPEQWPTVPSSDHPPSDAPFSVHRHPSVFNGRSGMYLLRGVQRTVRTIDPDALITHAEPWHFVTGELELAATRASIPHIVFTWENLYRVPNIAVQRGVERGLLPRIDGIIAGSDAAADRIRKRGFSGATTVAPQTGVAVEYFRPDVAIPDLREQFGVPAGDRIVLYAGRLAPEKGLDDLLDTVRPVTTGRDDVHYLIVGSGELAGALDRRIDDDRLHESVTLVTERQPYSRMPAIHALASVFVYPSRTIETWAEQFGYAVAEAMSCGVPVVTTECGALPYVVGESGVVCPENDPAALTAGIATLLDDDAERRRRGTAARDRVVDQFSRESVGRKHLAMVERLSRS